MQVEVDVGLARVEDRPWVLAFFHGTQWPLLAWRRRRRTAVLVSLSNDGIMQARALRCLGFRVVRGSSSRGGARGLAELTRAVRRTGDDAAFAVDGPRGPYGTVKGGAALAARATNGVVVPMGAAFAHGFVLTKAWDLFGVAWPFSRVTVCLGAPLEGVEAEAFGGEKLRAAIARANAIARSRLERSRPRLPLDAGAGETGE